jgi:hypothetical protein
MVQEAIEFLWIDENCFNFSQIETELNELGSFGESESVRLDAQIGFEQALLDEAGLMYIVETEKIFLESFCDSEPDWFHVG